MPEGASERAGRRRRARRGLVGRVPQDRPSLAPPPLGPPPVDPFDPLDAGPPVDAGATVGRAQVDEHVSAIQDGRQAHRAGRYRVRSGGNPLNHTDE